jgi:glycosyltransferase involved in cell wall biosynthesis
MTLSILILSFNHAQYIGDAISSAICQLSYLDNLELLILDDGSTDGTQDILRNLSVPPRVTLQLFLEKHRGVHAIARNFNFLIAQSTNQYVAFLASDDQFPPDAFKTQMAHLNTTPNCQFVYGNGVNFSGDRMLDRLHTGPLRDALEYGDPNKVGQTLTSVVPQLYIQALLVRRSFFDEFAPFDESLIADDWAFNIRIFRHLAERCQPFFFIDTIVFHRRLLDASTSNNLRVHYHRILQVARKYVTAECPVFYSYFYIRYAKTFVRQGMPGRAVSMLVRLIALKLGIRHHSACLEQVI